MKNIIVIYTYSPFPCGDANSNRFLAYALSMQSAGYKVIVLTNIPPRDTDYDVNTNVYSYMGIEYRSYFVPGLNKVQRIIHRNNIIKILNNCLSLKEQHNICLLCSSYRNFGLFLYIILKLKNIPSVVDVTEWHDSFQFKFGKFEIEYIIHDFKNRFIVPLSQNIICISRYLESYYKKCGCNTLYLPPQIILDDYLPHTLPKLPPIKFFYAGSLQKKDHMAIALEGFSLLSETEKEKILCTFVGSSEKEFIVQIPDGEKYINNLGNHLQIIAKISKIEVQKYLAESHFLILMRPVSRYSSAGFPSKVPEALAAGVPIITNATSDLSNYIVDMENGIIVEEFSAASFTASVRKAISLNDKFFKEMSNNAYACAKKYFNFSIYNETIKNYLLNICKS